MLGDLFAAGSGPSSWRSEVDFEDIWDGPAKKGRISAHGDKERFFQEEQIREQARQWEFEGLGEA